MWGRGPGDTLGRVIGEQLRFLYGPEVGDRTLAGLDRLLDRFRPRLSDRAEPAERFDQHDAILITYGDTFRAPGRSPLAALSAFAERHLTGRFSTLHVLPFFPSSSDYGFSVIDYLAVDPALGGWDDLERLRRGFKLMVDLVLNHVSAESAWFRAFLSGEAPYERFFIEADPRADLSAVTRPRTSPLLTRVRTDRGARHVWTTFSPDQVDLNYAEPAVLLRMLEVMLTYVERGADVLRLDAVGYLWKQPGTTCIHRGCARPFHLLAGDHARTAGRTGRLRP